MKKTISLIIAIILTVCLKLPVAAAAFSPQMNFFSERINRNSLDELNSRFTNFEANWSRFQLGGNLNISAITRTELNAPEFIQELGLFFNVNLDSNLQFDLRLSHSGGWGFSTTIPPLNSPLQIDEAFLRYQNQNSLHYLGRFRFSLGHLGLISDYIFTPAEGVALQYQLGSFYLSGLFVRIITPQFQIDPAQPIIPQENYLSNRIAWTNQAHIFGINLVPNGLAGERSFSFDYSFTQNNYQLNTELAWYSFHLNESPYPDLEARSINWTPGIMVSCNLNLSPATTLRFKTGFLSPEFTPAYSSLAHSSLDQREWFLPNSQGVEINWEQSLLNKFYLNNRLICLVPIQSAVEKNLNYHWLGSLAKQFSPVNCLELGAEIKQYPNYNYTKKQLFLKWNLQF